MSIFQMNANDIANVQGRSPAWLFDGDLMTGKVPSGCQLRPSMPGIPQMCNPVHPEFLSAIGDFLYKNPVCAAYGSNANAAIAEDVVEGTHYALAYNSTSGKLYASENDAPLASKDDLPLRMVFLLSMPFFMKDAEFSAAMERLQNAQTDDDRKKEVAILYDNAYMRDKDNEITQAFENRNLLRLTAIKAQAPALMPTEQFGAPFITFKNVGTNAATGIKAAIVTANASTSAS